MAAMGSRNEKGCGIWMLSVTKWPHLRWTLAQPQRPVLLPSPHSPAGEQSSGSVHYTPWGTIHWVEMEPLQFGSVRGPASVPSPWEPLDTLHVTAALEGEQKCYGGDCDVTAAHCGWRRKVKREATAGRIQKNKPCRNTQEEQ